VTGTELIPHPDTLQVHWLIFEILLIVTFVLHLLLMNVMLGGSILAAVSGWKRGRVPEEAHELPITIALAVNFGVPPLLFVQVLYGHLFYTSSVLMGAFWLSVIPVLLIAYYAAYLSVHNLKKPISALWSTVSAVLLLFIAFVYVNNMTLYLDQGNWPEWFDNRSGTILNLSEPSLWPRYLHMVVGALAVTFMSWAVWGWYREKRGGPPAKEQIERGLKMFWMFSALEVLLGVAWLVTLPKDVMMLFMGKSAYASVLLMLGVLLSLFMIMLALMKKLWPTFISLIVTMLVMILLRDVVRGGYLSQVFSPGELEVKLSISPLILFLVSFVVGLGVLAWMLITALDPRQRIDEAGGES